MDQPASKPIFSKQFLFRYGLAEVDGFQAEPGRRRHRFGLGLGDAPINEWKELKVKVPGFQLIFTRISRTFINSYLGDGFQLIPCHI